VMQVGTEKPAVRESSSRRLRQKRDRTHELPEAASQILRVGRLVRKSGKRKSFWGMERKLERRKQAGDKFFRKGSQAQRYESGREWKRRIR